MSKSTRVGHCKLDSTDTYAGRGHNAIDMKEAEIGERGWLGNPFTLNKHNRTESINLFHGYFVERLENDEEFREAIKRLQGDVLGCWCQQLEESEPACHAEVIAECADRLGGGDDQ